MRVDETINAATGERTVVAYNGDGTGERTVYDADGAEVSVETVTGIPVGDQSPPADPVVELQAALDAVLEALEAL